MKKKSDDFRKFPQQSRAYHDYMSLRLIGMNGHLEHSQ